MTTLMDAAAWQQAWSPRRPLATDDLLAGCWRQSRDRALTRRYLEHSPKALQTMLVVDVDHPDALERAIGEPRNHPMPSWVAEGVNGRGHVGWVLRTPVCRTDAARLEPMRFAAKVEEGLRRSLGGDVGYAGLLTKNPLHPDWYPHWGRGEPYGLDELAAGLGSLVPPKLPKRSESTGLGRNVALFEDLRRWAYRARRGFEQRSEWDVAVLEKAAEHNASIPVPLPPTEVRQTAASVGTWVWRRSFDQAGFRRVQRSRGRRGGAANTPAQQSKKRLGPGQASHEEALAYVEALRAQQQGTEGEQMPAKYPQRRPATSKAMAEQLGWNTRRVERFMAEPRQDFLARAAARREKAVELRAAGRTYAEIAAEMECSTGTVGRLLHDAKKLTERAAADQQSQAS